MFKLGFLIVLLSSLDIGVRSTQIRDANLSPFGQIRRFESKIGRLCDTWRSAIKICFGGGVWDHGCIIRTGYSVGGGVSIFPMRAAHRVAKSLPLTSGVWDLISEK